MDILGKPIIVNDFLVKQILIKMCRSKKKRIKKKWLKNPRNYKTIPDPNFYVTETAIICHPSLAIKIKEVLRETGNRNSGRSPGWPGSPNLFCDYLNFIYPPSDPVKERPLFYYTDDIKIKGGFGSDGTVC